MTLSSKQPYQTIHWQDGENTGATGWIVIHNLINGMAGGGVFMHSRATLQEVKDLARTMSLKNLLPEPSFGGGKAGIRFDHHKPDAREVLKRFLKDNLDIIQSLWCTGGDLNTRTQDISALLNEVSASIFPFTSLANMVQSKLKMNVDRNRFEQLLLAKENHHLAIEEAITGFGLFQAIIFFTKKAIKKPRIVIQGFGKVGKALCYYAKDKFDIVGICEKDWFIVNPQGIDINALLENLESNLKFYHPHLRIKSELDDVFLIRFLKLAQADIFCPCAIRYSISRNVIKTLISYTFFNHKDNYIISGANNVFARNNILRFAIKNNITVVPEWLSNSGCAILFVEAMKYNELTSDWLRFIKKMVSYKIKIFLNKAVKFSSINRINIYDSCSHLAEIKFKRKMTENVHKKYSIFEVIPHQRVIVSQPQSEEIFDLYQLGLFLAPDSRLAPISNQESFYENLELVELQEMKKYRPHFHKDSQAIIYIISGVGDFVLGDIIYPYQAGKRIVIPSGTLHGFITKTHTLFLSIQAPPIIDPVNKQIDIHYEGSIKHA